MVIDRVKFFIEYMSMSVSAFEKSVGLPNGYISKIKKNVGQDKLEDILRVYPHLRREWLSTGEGEMLQNPNAERLLQANIVPLLPSFALGCSIDEYLSAHAHDSQGVVSPVQGGDFALKMVCDSMVPEYPVGSMMIARRVDFESFVEWGKVYVLETSNGLMVRRVMPSSSDGALRCEANNPKYPDVEIPIRELRSLYRVVILIITK